MPRDRISAASTHPFFSASPSVRHRDVRVRHHPPDRFHRLIAAHGIFNQHRLPLRQREPPRHCFTLPGFARDKSICTS